jgi:DNA gyrase subunit B
VDAAGVWLTARELLDNALDEHLAHRNDAVMLHVDKDGSYWVLDRGHGVPQGVKKFSVHVNGKDIETKMPTMQAVFGELHTSGKYRSDAYATSVGTHGIGAKGTNATSEFFEVFTFYEGQWFTIGFKKGKLVKHVAKCSAPKGPDGKTVTKGTVIHFKPDPTIFTVKSFPPSMVMEWADVMSHLNPGFAIVVSSPKGKKQFLSKIGPAGYVQQRIEKLKTEAERLMFEYKSDLADVVVAFSNYDGCDVRGFTNGLNNAQGGKHLDAVTGALYAGLKPYIKTKRVEGKPVPVFREADFKEGLVGLVNAKLHKAEFSSQDKARLTDARMGAAFEKELTLATIKFFKDNKALALRLCARATKLNELKTKFTLSKKAASTLNAMKRNGLPAKYAGFDSKTKTEDRELFIVEGDSAGGTVKKGRFPYQAVLPLKGKIMNALKDGKGKTLESEEILNILAAIGFDVKAVDPYAKLTVGKIVCLADPDPDGPFIGDTRINFRYNTHGTTQSASIECLAKMAADGTEFVVPVWNGQTEVWASASARLERNVEQLVALEIGKTKYKVSVDHKWLCVKTDALRGRDVGEHADNLVFVRAADLKVGDRVFMPAANNTRDKSSCDYATKLGFAPVSKMRIQQLDQPVPVYCLSVPKYHHFMLPSGIVSSNCHINSLLLTLFYRYLPELFSRGMVFVANSPEFYSVHKNQLVTGESLSAMGKNLKRIKAPANTPIHHIKGWGEIDAPLMRILAMDPATRKLIKIGAIEHDDKVDFERLMNDDVAYRRDMLGLPSNAVGGDVEEEGTPKSKAARKVPVNKAVVAAKKIATANRKIVHRRDEIEAKRIEKRRGLRPVGKTLRKAA